MSDAVHPCALDRLPREFRMYAHTSFSAPLPRCHVQDNSLLVAKKKKKKSAELEKALRLAHHGRHLLKRGGKKSSKFISSLIRGMIKRLRWQGEGIKKNRAIWRLRMDGVGWKMGLHKLINVAAASASSQVSGAYIAPRL